MPEFWHKSQQRGRETVAFWRQYHPSLTVRGTTPDAHAADIARLEPLAQALAAARTHVKTMKQAELAAFARLRLLNLAVPLLIAGRFDVGHPVRSALPSIYAVVPRSDALNLRRARRLIAVWRQANAALAARKPGDAIMRDDMGVTEFAQLVRDYPQTLSATAGAVTAFRQARTQLRQQHRRVDDLNKRAYGKFTAETLRDKVKLAALRAAITREKTSGSRRRRSRQPLAVAADSSHNPA
jgi:hypothetical protein